MFKCYMTGRNSKDKPVKVIIERRERQYFSEDEPNKVVATGWEIVKEVLMSKEGYAIWQAKNGKV